MYKKIIGSMAAAAMVFSVSVVQAENNQYVEGVDQLRSGNYQYALPALESSAEQGDPRSAFQLALMYHGGLEVEFNEEKAVELYKVAAAQGIVEAQQFLAAGYREGWWGLPMDYQKYRYWMDKSQEAHL